MKRFSIGIDLGTTNCALAYRPLNGGDGAPSQILALPQWGAPGQVVERSTLPSFLYRPLTGEEAAFREGPGLADGWVVGLAARAQTARTPARVVHSAKSWLAHHGSDPAAALLPWKSEALGETERISPLAASAAYLGALRSAWDAAFLESPFAAQEVVVTVPASFDLAAQEATLAAARRAGFGPDTRLLEEPQAAFYRWLEAMGERGSSDLRPGEQVLVVDVGGGTSDFSLFRVGEGALERVAVSEHLLLGGDNIDLALAHFLEAQLVGEGEELRGEAWNFLVARARELKENALAERAPELFRVAAPGRGSSLLAQAASAEIPTEAVREIVLEGFFPPCGRYERPSEDRSALQEWGLPYAADFAVTRYLADFLRDLPPVDAVLFNGGTLQAPLLRERLVEQVAAWQEGRRPRVLANAELDLAVARGAAFFGSLSAEPVAEAPQPESKRERAVKIEAGAARGLFLEVATEAGERRVVCALPRGTAAEVSQMVTLPGLRVRLNERVVFRAFQGSHRRDDALGAVSTWNASDFTALPPLEAQLDSPETSHALVSVRLETRLSELGSVRIEVVPADEVFPGEIRWSLAFNLRGKADDVPADHAAPAPARWDADDLDRARKRLTEGLVRGGVGKRRRLTAAAVFEACEQVLGLPRFKWPLPLVRALADTLLEAPENFSTAADETLETRLQLTGWLLRPGFGDGADPSRLEAVMRAFDPLEFPIRKRFEPAYSLMWRRLVGGLPATFQERLWASRGTLWLDPRKVSPEGVRLAGMLERQPPETRQQLATTYLQEAETRLCENGHAGPYLAALAGLLGRFGLRPDAHRLPPALVETAWERLGSLGAKNETWRKDWANLFLRAARRVEDERLNLAPRLSRRIADRLEKAGLSPQRTQPLREYLPLAATDTATLHEDTLPPGLVLG